MVLFMKVTGFKMKFVDVEDLFIVMDLLLQEIGKIIKLKDLVFKFI